MLLSRKCIGIWFCICLCFSPTTGSCQNSTQFPHAQWVLGGLQRLDTTRSELYLVFTGHEYADGGAFIRKALQEKSAPAHFFFTGDFYRNRRHRKLIRRLRRDGHYLGAHSDRHLLYVSWQNRDSLLVDRETFRRDVLDNYAAMRQYRIQKKDAPYFMPPYEWYNQQISDWTRALGLQLINFTPGTYSNADYTTPDMGERYYPSRDILDRILAYEVKDPNGLNGFLLLLHIGTHPSRKDKLYHYLPELIDTLRARGYTFAALTEIPD